MRPVTITQTGVGSTQWVAVSPHISQSQLSVACTVTGTVSYTVEYTFEDVNYTPNSQFAYNITVPTVSVFPDATVAAKTDNQIAYQNDPIWAARVTIVTGTGSVKATFLQAGIAGN